MPRSLLELLDDPQDQVEQSTELQTARRRRRSLTELAGQGAQAPAPVPAAPAAPQPVARKSLMDLASQTTQTAPAVQPVSKPAAGVISPSAAKSAAPPEPLAPPAPAAPSIDQIKKRWGPNITAAELSRLKSSGGMQQIPGIDQDIAALSQAEEQARRQQVASESKPTNKFTEAGGGQPYQPPKEGKLKRALSFVASFGGYAPGKKERNKLLGRTLGAGFARFAGFTPGKEREDQVRQFMGRLGASPDETAPYAAEKDLTNEQVLTDALTRARKSVAPETWSQLNDQAKRKLIDMNVDRQYHPTSSMFDKPGAGEALEQIGAHAGQTLTPFAGDVLGLPDAAELMLAANAADAGNASKSQLQLLDKFVDRMEVDYLRSGADTGMADAANQVAGNVVTLLAQQPKFWAEIAATGGIYEGGKNVAMKAMESRLAAWLTKRIMSRAAGRLAVKAATGAAGVAVQQAFVPGMSAQDYLQQRTPGFARDEHGNLHKIKDARSAMSAAIHAPISTFIELFTERTGEYLAAAAKPVTNLLSHALDKIPGKVKAQAAMAAIKQWLHLNPNKTVADFFANVAEKTQWHGTIPEIGEEELGKVMHWLFSAGADGYDLTTGTAGAIPRKEDGQWTWHPLDLLTEGISFWLPGLSRQVAGSAASLAFPGLRANQENPNQPRRQEPEHISAESLVKDFESIWPTAQAVNSGQDISDQQLADYARYTGRLMSMTDTEAEKLPDQLKKARADLIKQRDAENDKVAQQLRDRGYTDDQIDEMSIDEVNAAMAAPAPQAGGGQDRAGQVVIPGKPTETGSTSAVDERYGTPFAGQPIQQVQGRPNKVALSDGNELPGHYAAVEADRLIPSHDPLNKFAVNQTGDLNERPYHDTQQGATSRATVQRIARQPNPDLLLTDTVTPVDGPPIIAPTGQVLGGNARAMGIQLSYARFANASGRIRQATVEAAGKFGLDPQQLAGMKNPVIVRVLDEPGTRGQLSRILNEAMTVGKQDVVEAVSKAHQVTPATANLVSSWMQPDAETGQVPSLSEVLDNGERSMQIAQRMVQDGIWRQSDIDKNWNARTGRLNEAGRATVSSVMLARVLADARTMDELPAGPRNKLVSALGPLTESSLSKQNVLIDKVRQAAAAFPMWKAARMSVKEFFFDQQNLQPPPGYRDRAVVALVHAMDRMTPHDFRQAANTYLDIVGRDSGQMTLAGQVESADQEDAIVSAFSPEVVGKTVPRQQRSQPAPSRESDQEGKTETAAPAQTTAADQAPPAQAPPAAPAVADAAPAPAVEGQESGKSGGSSKKSVPESGTGQEKYVPKDGWRKHLIKAREYAAALGIDHQGKKLIALVREIDQKIKETADAGQVRSNTGQLQGESSGDEPESGQGSRGQDLQRDQDAGGAAGDQAPQSGTQAGAPKKKLKKIRVKPHDDLTDDQRAVESRLIALIQDRSKADALYDQISDSKGGKVIGTDIARFLAPEYHTFEGRLEYTKATGRPAGAYADDRYFRALRDTPERSDGQPRLLATTAGGVASGKSSSIDDNVTDSADLVLDTQMRGFNGSVLKIDAAIKLGWDVNIYYVQRPFPLVVQGAIDRAHKEGRWGSVLELAQIHMGVQQTMSSLAEKYRDHPQVHITGLYNTWTPENPVKAEVFDLSRIAEGGDLRYTDKGELDGITRRIADEARKNPDYDPALLDVLFEDAKHYRRSSQGDSGHDAAQPQRPRGQEGTGRSEDRTEGITDAAVPSIDDAAALEQYILDQNLPPEDGEGDENAGPVAETPPQPGEAPAAAAAETEDKPKKKTKRALAERKSKPKKKTKGDLARVITNPKWVTAKTREEWEASGDKIVAPAVYANGKLFKGTNHGDALNRAVDAGAVVKDEEGRYVDAGDGTDIMRSDRADLFATAKGYVIDRLTADQFADINSTESMTKGKEAASGLQEETTKVDTNSSSVRATRAKADDARAAFKATLGELANYTRGKLYVNPMADPHLWRLTARATAQGVSAGIYEFADLVSAVAEQLGKATTLLIGPHLEKAWGQLRQVDRQGRLGAPGSVEKLLADVSDSDTIEGESEASDAGTGRGSALADRSRGSAGSERAGEPSADSEGAGGLFEQPAESKPESGQPGSERSGEPGGNEPGASSPPVAEAESEPAAEPTGSGDEAGRGQSVARPPAEQLPVDQRDHVITSDMLGDLAPRTDTQKFAANVKAIKLLRKLKAENRNATPEEKEILSHYTGWGWAGEYFSATNEKYAKQYEQLKTLLNDEEFRSARESTVNAHYTDSHIIDAMWKMAVRLGFKGGPDTTILEPAAGIGHFLGVMPQDMTGGKRIAVELDKISADITAKLYPQAEVQNSGFEVSKIPNNSIDLAISNVPFGSWKLEHGRDYPNLYIHDYFFARGLDKVKPGGLVMFITSDGTMQKLDRSVRSMLADKADLVGAVRLPKDAFLKTAGTSVTTDIIILRKKMPAPFAEAQDWINLQKVGGVKVADILAKYEERKQKHLNDENLASQRKWQLIDNIQARIDAIKAKGVDELPILANEYFVNHPDMALGKHTLEGTMYSDYDYALSAPKTQDTAALLDAAVDKLPPDIYNKTSAATYADQPGENDADLAQGNLSYHLGDGGMPYQIVDGQKTEPEWLQKWGRGATPDRPLKGKERTKRLEVARSYIKVRDLVQEIYDAEADENTTDDQLQKLRDRLSTVWGSFAHKYGSFSRQRSGDEPGRFLEDDPDYYKVLAIEQEVSFTKPVKVKGKTIDKVQIEYIRGDIFTKRINEPVKMPTTADSIEDAVAISLGWRNAIDPELIGQLLGKSPAAARDMVLATEQAFEDPQSGELVMASRYLSGNVRKKLAKAKEADADSPRYERNVRALAAAQPKEVPINEVDFQPASRWIPPAVFEAFIEDVMESKATVKYIAAVDNYVVNFKTFGTALKTSFSTERKSGDDLMSHALAGTEPTVYDYETDADGTKHRYLNPKATEAARAMVEKIGKALRDYVMTTDRNLPAAAVGQTGDELPMMMAMEAAYNDNNNAVVSPEYDGSYLALPGLSSLVYRYPHRLSVVARVLQEGGAVMAHGVGSGKTFSQVIIAHEMKRLGLAKKPLIVVERATLGQFVAAYRQAYPHARLLVSNDKSLTPQKRKAFLNRIKTGDWEAVIMTQPQFNDLPLGEDMIRGYFNKMIGELEAAMQEAADADGKSSPTVKQLVKSIKALRKRLQKMIDSARKHEEEGVYPFHELGVDSLLVDECFTYETLIITDRGELPIGQIVEQFLPVNVLARNPDTGGLEWKPVINWISKPLGGCLVRVYHEGGSFTCTPNHKIFTEEDGYVCAGQLKANHTLIRLRGSTVPVVREDHEGTDQGPPCQTEQAILQQGVLGVLEEHPSSHQRTQSGTRLESAGRLEQGPAVAGVVRKDASQEPIEASGRESEDQPGHSGPGLSGSPRRQRSCCATATGYSGQGAGMEDRARGEDQVGLAAIHGSPASPLQNRHIPSHNDGGDRSGRTLSRLSECQGSRPQEGPRTESSRVARVEILEPEYSQRLAQRAGCGAAVYDLEVADHHNYFANGACVSNCHAYKRAPIITKKVRIKGIPNDQSQRAMKLMVKVGHVQALHNGRNTIGSSGTPITNTLAEGYVMLQLFTPNVLKEFNISSFDGFANTFGRLQEKGEFTWDQKFKMVQRFNKFVNGHELARLVRSGFDIKIGNEKLGLKVPKVVGGKAELVTIEETDTMGAVGDWLYEIAQKYDKLDGEDKKVFSWVPIATMQLGVTAAIDPRLVDENLPDDPASKVNTAVKKVVELYKRYDKTNGTQLIFADRFKKDPERQNKLMDFADGKPSELMEADATDEDGELVYNADEADTEDNRLRKEDADYKAAGFNLYHDIRDKLIAAGVPADEIAIIHDYSEKTRDAMFEKVQNGEIRVLLGSTEKMGVGVNVQDRLVAIHHLDPPRMMTPAMMEQRDGRGIRQKNMNEYIHILKYGCKRSMDLTIYQALESKGKMVAQFMTEPESLGREFEDPSDDVILSNSEMIASLVDDSRVLKRVELESKRNKLRERQASHEAEQAHHLRQIKQDKPLIDIYAAKAKRAAAAAEQLEKILNAHKDWGDSELDGKKYDIRKDLVFAIQAKMEKEGKHAVNLGTYYVGQWTDPFVVNTRGLQLAISTSTTSHFRGGNVELEPQWRMDVRDRNGNSIASAEISSADSALRFLPMAPGKLNSDAASFRGRSEELRKSVAQRQAELKPFPEADQLKKVEYDLKALMEDLVANPPARRKREKPVHTDRVIPSIQKGRRPRLGGMTISQQDQPVLPAGSYIKASNKRWRRLIRRIEQDPKGRKVGVRSIVAELARHLAVEIRVGLEQTTERNPSHYIQDSYHLIRTRLQHGNINFHELGHAMEALVRSNDPVFLDKVLGNAMVKMTKRPDSMASAENAAEGFAEWVRLTVTSPGSRPSAITNRIERYLKDHAPDLLTALSDARLAYRAHENRGPDAILRSATTDHPHGRTIAKMVVDLHDEVLFGVSAGSALHTRVRRPVMRALRRISGKLAREFDQSVQDTPADVLTAHQMSLHAQQEIGRAIHGLRGGGGGIRVTAVGDQPLAKLREQLTLEEADRFDKLFTLPADVRHGEWLNLTDFSLGDIIAKVGEKDWEDFEVYGWRRAAMSRYEQKGQSYPTINEGNAPSVMRDRIAAAEAQHPEWKKHFEEINRFMDQSLLVPLLAGELTPQEAINIAEAWYDYWPLPRAMSRQPRRKSGAGANPTAGIKRAYGSEIAFDHLRHAVGDRIKMAIEAYYHNASMLSIHRYAENLANNKHVPLEVRAIGRRIMVPLHLDWKKVAELNEHEQQGVVARQINLQKARELGWKAPEATNNRGEPMELPDDEIYDHALRYLTKNNVKAIEGQDVVISFPGSTADIWRQVKPKAIRVIAPWIGGQRSFFQIEDPILFEFYARVKKPNVQLVAFADAVNGMVQPWKRGITQTWPFTIWNAFSRDPSTAVILGDTKGAFLPMGYMARGIVNRITGGVPEAVSQSELLSKQLDAVTHLAHRNAVQRFLDVLGEGWYVKGYWDMGWASKALHAPGQAMSLLLKPVDMLNYMTGARAAAEFSEKLSREGVYVAQRQAGASAARAQRSYDHVTGNFGERPGWPNLAAGIRAAGFLNPGVQILVSSYMRFTEGDLSLSKKAAPWASRGEFAVKLGWLMVVGAVAAAINFLLLDDDDIADLKERTDEDRLRYMGIKFPFAKGVMLRMPFDYGPTGAATGLGWNMMEGYLAEEPIAGKKHAELALKRALDIPSVVDLASPFVKTLLEAKVNYSFFFNEPIVPPWMLDTYPDDPELQAWSNTPGFYKWVGQKLGVSPIKVEYVTRGALTNQLADMIRGSEDLINRQPPAELAEWPFLGRIFQREPKGWRAKSVQQLGDLDRAYNATRLTLQRLTEEGSDLDSDEVKALTAKLQALQVHHQQMLHLKALWNQVRALRKVPMDQRTAEQRKMIMDAERQMRDLARKMMKDGQ